MIAKDREREWVCMGFSGLRHLDRSLWKLHHPMAIHKQQTDVWMGDLIIEDNK